MLKTFALAAAAALATAPALAQDAPAGVYAGTTLAYGRPKAEMAYSPSAGALQRGDADKGSIAYGGFLGFGTLVGERLYLAVEGDLATGGGDISRTLGGAAVKLDPGMRWGVGGRGGFLVGDDGLLYGKVGMERRKVKVSNGRTTQELDLQGVAYGVGYQHMLGDGFGLRAELTRVDYGDETARFAGGDTVNVESDETRFSLGGAVHF